MELLDDYFILKSFYCMGQEHDKCFSCQYCRARDKGNTKGYWTAPSEINPLFTVLPVVVNIFYGDPLLYTEDLERCLDILEEHNHKGPVVIITKGRLDSDKAMKILSKKRNLRIHFGLSYFGVELFDINGTAANLHNNLSMAAFYNKNFGYTYNIEYRPLINGINDTDKQMTEVFELARMYKTSIAYSGLQVEKELEEHIKKYNLPFKPYDGFEFGMKKNISREVECRIRQYSDKYKVPVFRKTSCAITYAANPTASGWDWDNLPPMLNTLEIVTYRDYNAHYYRPNEVGCPDCPNKRSCHNFKRHNDEFPHHKWTELLPFNMKLVKKEHHSCKLHRDGLCKFPSPDCLDINGYMFQTDRKLTTSDVRVIKWITGYTVDAEFVESPYLQKDWLVCNKK